MRKSHWLTASALLVLGMGVGHAGCYTSGTPGGLGAGGSQSEGGAANTDGSNEDDAGDAGDAGLSNIEKCETSADCAENDNGKVFCELTAKQCVQCIVSTDCLTPIADGGSQPDSNQYCYKNACAKYTACKTALDCVHFADAGNCDSNLHCVQCNFDADCTAAGLSETRCLGHVCRLPCASEVTCNLRGLLCNLDAGACTERCSAPSDCSPWYTCSTDRCVPTN